jgi:hypothetical protein
MGNCPSEFAVSPSGGGCILQCPASKNYELKSEGQKLSCVYTADPTISVPLTVVPNYYQNPPGPPVSYQSLANKSIYQTEIDRFTNAMAIADGKIDKTLKLKTAVTALQDAEAVRDQAPDAYQSARITYYTMVKGDGWIEQEKARIANVEAQPVVNDYMKKYNDLQQKKQEQKSVLEVANAMKNKLLSVQGNLEYSVGAFQKQIGAIKNQINMDKKKQIEQAESTTTWIDTLLNWLIALTTIIAVVLLVRYYMRSRVQSPVPSTLPPR